MSEKSMIFGDKKINEGAFNKDEKLIQADSKDVDKILVPKKEPCGKRRDVSRTPAGSKMGLFTTLDNVIKHKELNLRCCGGPTYSSENFHAIESREKAII